MSRVSRARDSDKIVKFLGRGLKLPGVSRRASIKKRKAETFRRSHKFGASAARVQGMKVETGVSSSWWKIRGKRRFRRLFGR